jgi:hypothetical protein
LYIIKSGHLFKKGVLQEGGGIPATDADLGGILRSDGYGIFPSANCVFFTTCRVADKARLLSPGRSLIKIYNNINCLKFRPLRRCDENLFGMSFALLALNYIPAWSR